jgi:creatinine amidohydrolase
MRRAALLGWAVATAVLGATVTMLGAAQRDGGVSTRELTDVNWMEFKELVPARIDTVLVPTGTLEPHGVINNGADVTAPVALARAIAPKVNAMVAPVIPYGVTGSMDAYPGSFSISEAAYRAYVKDVLAGLAKTGFRTIVVVNGHGGPQTAVLNDVAREVGQEKKVRTLVVNWWSYASDVTKSVFGEDGGHAGLNETAYIQAINPKLVHPERYSDALAFPNAAPGTYSAYPAPASIGLYTPGQGLVKFDQAKADAYFARVNEKVAGLVIEMKKRWDAAGL